MTRSMVPSYRFTFHGGLSQRGSFDRSSSAIDHGRVHRFRYFLDDDQLLSTTGLAMPRLVADLVDVCVAVYLADRQAWRVVPGDVRPSSERWHRMIEMTIQVRCPAVWQTIEVTGRLEDLAFYLTHDDWAFHFVPRQASPRSAEGQLRLFPGSRGSPPLVALNSGGLDSLFGLIQGATSGKFSTLLAVSITTHARRHRVIEQVLDALRPSFSDLSIEYGRLKLGISAKGRARDDREGSQRARVLPCLAAGVAVAATTGADWLQVTENGPGAINLPCTLDQTGAHVTRAMHPKTLGLFAEFASLVLDRPIRISNTGLFQTKRELVERLLDQRFDEATRLTVSCERFPYLLPDQACGTCPSCLYRRIALQADSSRLDAKRYDTDLLDPAISWSTIDTIPLVALRESVERLRQLLASPTPFHALAAAFPTLFDVLDAAPHIGLGEAEIESRIVRLFQAHVLDTEAFFAKVDRMGWGRRANVVDFEARQRAQERVSQSLTMPTPTA